MPEMSREEREDLRAVEEQLARASNIPDITGPGGEVLLPGRRPDHLGPAPEPAEVEVEEPTIPEGYPQTFRELAYWMLDQARAGDLIVGWHETGVAWFCDRGDTVDDGVEILDPAADDVPLLVGVAVMQQMGLTQAKALAEDVRARKMAAAQSRIIVPGTLEPRRVRRERERAQARAERQSAQAIAEKIDFRPAATPGGEAQPPSLGL